VHGRNSLHFVRLALQGIQAAVTLARIIVRRTLVGFACACSRPSTRGHCGGMGFQRAFTAVA
jgi:hypothetical protein